MLRDMGLEQIRYLQGRINDINNEMKELNTRLPELVAKKVKAEQEVEQLWADIKKL